MKSGASLDAKNQRLSISLHLLVLVLLVPSALLGRQATELYGTVTNKDSGEAVPDVNVYLSYTTAGAATDENGSFSFFTPLQGQFELVFSAVGYQSQRFLITLGNNSNLLEVNAEMEPKPVELDEVEIKADNSEWVRNYEVFEQEFLGRTYNAQETEIINRWVLNFEMDESGELTARADGPIRIENRALGYDLIVDLDEFRWNQRERTGFYKVKVWFDQKSPESQAEYRNWQRKRRGVYNGSLRHFLKSLYEDRLFSNRFELVWRNTRQQASIKMLDRDEVELALKARNQDNQLPSDELKGFLLREPVDVLYGRKSIRNDRRQRSTIISMVDDQIILVSPDGNLVDINSIATAGYWSAMRMADMVSIDYRP